MFRFKTKEVVYIMKAISTLLVCFFSLFYCNAQEKKALPNIIYILADDLGIGDLSTFNEQGKIATPNLDALAAQGVKFTDAHTSSSVCTPTRYGIITGRYNWRGPLKQSVLTGTSKAIIPANRSTVASILKSKKYETAFIGKWHLGWDWALKTEDENLGEGWNPKDFSNIDFSRTISNGPTKCRIQLFLWAFWFFRYGSLCICRKWYAYPSTTNNYSKHRQV